MKEAVEMFGRLSSAVLAPRWARASIIVTVAAAISVALVPTTAEAAAARTAIWSKSYNPLHSAAGTAIAVDPADQTVFVGGSLMGGSHDFVVGAYAADTGDRRWIKREPTGATPYMGSWTMDLAISPDGGALYLMGTVRTTTHKRDVVTMALDPSSGAVIWTATSSGANDYNAPTMRTSPVGDRIFVAMPVGRVNYLRRRGERVIAYDANTGNLTWQARITGVASASPSTLLAVTPDGKSVVLSMTKQGRSSEQVKTVALDTATGSTVWLSRFGRPTNHNLASDIVLSPDGGRVYVSDYRWDVMPGGEGEMIRWPVVLAYDTADGTRLWKAVVEGAIGATMHLPLAANADQVFLTNGYAIGSLSAQDGTAGWVTRTNTLPGYWYGTVDVAMTVSPSGGRLYVVEPLRDERTDSKRRLETAAVATGSGVLKWTAVRRGPSWGRIAAGSGGTRVYVAGAIPNSSGGYLAWFTMAYQA
jgi:hypothetical protein